MGTAVTLTLDGLDESESVLLGRGCRALPTLTGTGLADQHARLLQKNGIWCVQDLGSAAGTLLNGVEVYGAKPVCDGDVLTLADNEVVLRCSSGRRAPGKPPQSRAGSPSVLTVAALSVVVPGRVLLEKVSFAARAGEFIGILGPSGCGKSTLIKAIAGLMPAAEGSISLSSDSPRSEAAAAPVAYLPQDVIIHDQLSVEKALTYISAFKSAEESLQEDKASVHRVVDRVSLSDRVHVRIASLSGGQKKRVGLAAELLGEPQIILLDEATSGLDPATEADQMELFRSLAESGKTVLCVTHNPARLNLCHRVLFMASGRLLFDGSPQRLVEAMGVRNLDEVYRLATRSPAEKLAAVLALPSSSTEPSALPTASAPGNGDSPGLQTRPFNWQLFLSQSRLLVSRYADLVFADWRNLALLIGQAPAIAFLVVATFGNIRADFAELHAARLKEVFLIQALAVLWCSGTASIREIVKEWPLLRHEQRYGLLPSGVLLSKFMLLGVMAIVQAAFLTAIVKVGCGITGSWYVQLGVLSVLGCVGVLQGLCISAFAGTSERAMTVLPVLLIGEAILSGGFATLQGITRLLAQVLNPAYWALDGLRTTLSTELLIATYPGAPGTFQPPILGFSGPLVLDLTMLTVQGVGLFGATYVFFCAGLASRWTSGFWGGLKGMVSATARR